MGLLLCCEASESASNVHIFQLSIFWVCSDMINWSGNQCEGIGYVTLLLKDNQVLLPYWTYDSKSNVDLVLLADIFQTHSSSNTAHKYAVHHQIQFIKYSCNKTYIHTIFSAGYKMFISCRCSQFSSNHQVSCLGLGGTAYKGPWIMWPGHVIVSPIQWDLVMWPYGPINGFGQSEKT